MPPNSAQRGQVQRPRDLQQCALLAQSKISKMGEGEKSEEKAATYLLMAIAALTGTSERARGAHSNVRVRARKTRVLHHLVALLGGQHALNAIDSLRELHLAREARRRPRLRRQVKHVELVLTRGRNRGEGGLVKVHVARRARAGAVARGLDVDLGHVTGHLHQHSPHAAIRLDGALVWRDEHDAHLAGGGGDRELHAVGGGVDRRGSGGAEAGGEAAEHYL